MKLELPPGQFKAYLFDCDGTIADSMPIHYQSWQKSLAHWSVDFPLKQFYDWAGTPGDRTVELLNEMHSLSMLYTEVIKRKDAYYLELLSDVKGIESVIAHIDLMHGKIPLAVVSGSPREAVIKTLEALSLLEKFQTIVASEDYTRGKPSPDPFLIAAKRLGVSPKDCLVFEDANLGIQSAEAAGMKWVRVPSPISLK